MKAFSKQFQTHLPLIHSFFVSLLLFIYLLIDGHYFTRILKDRIFTVSGTFKDVLASNNIYNLFPWSSVTHEKPM